MADHRTALTTNIGFGGGCHWCTEAVFQALKGVYHVAQGFAKSTAPFDTWSEAALVTFDPTIVSLDALITVHLETHASSAAHKMRGKYRSAIYVVDERQRYDATDILGRVQERNGAARPLVTQVLALDAFKRTDPKFQNYYARDPARPFCKTYIEPKLAKMRQAHPQLLRSTA